MLLSSNCLHNIKSSRNRVEISFYQMFMLEEQNQGNIQFHIKGIEHSYMGY
jgi:hypothetical protein